MNLIIEAINADIRKNNGRGKFLENANLILETRDARIHYEHDSDPYWRSWVEYGSEGQVLLVYSSYGECTGQ
ncbi:Bgt-50655 [Blumeria graminis f. sp. tritici]|uniref:Bgt-50655 n=1 Tax=Blumeria graminis f. sp. tritici TaxID=62690 RepID=A0A9X9MLC9_BLUGR|nr:Bgt-50655 [Blumeria graminis f. sp. tritici]